MSVVQAVTDTTKVIPLSYAPSHSALHPTLPILYTIDPEHKKVHAINYETKETQELFFEETPRKVVFYNNHLYISLTKSIVLATPDTLAIIDQFHFSSIFGDFVVKDDYIFLGSEGLFDSLVYSMSKRQYVLPLFGQRDSLANPFKNTKLLLHPYLNRVYETFGNGSVYANVYQEFDSDNTNTSSPKAYIPIRYRITFLKASPDGQYIFDNGGQVSDANLQPVTLLGHELSDIAFNPVNMNFYTSFEKSIRIYTYAYDNPYAFRTFKQYASRQTLGTIVQLHYQSNQVLAVTKANSGAYQIEILPVPDAPKPQPNYEDKEFLAVNFAPKDLVFDPSQPIAYMTHPEEKKIYSYNYETKQTSHLLVEDIPEKLTFANGKLYVSLTKIPFVDWEEDAGPGGSILTINPQTMTLIDKISLQENPYDFTVDEQGFIYVLGKTTEPQLSSYSETTKQQIAIYPLNKTKPNSVVYNPTNKKLYLGGHPPCTIPVEKGHFGTKIDLFTGRAFHYPIVSPDGKFVFGGTVIYDSSNDHLIDFGETIHNVFFDTDLTKFFVQLDDRTVGVYDYATLVKDKEIKGIGNLSDLDPIKYSRYLEDKIVNLSLSSVNDQGLEDTLYFKNQHYLETVDLSSPLSLVGNGDSAPKAGSANSTIARKPIVIGFNGAIINGDHLEEVMLKDADNVEIPVVVFTFNRFISVIPQMELKYDTKYTVTIPSGAVQSYSGQGNAPLTMSFRTDQEFTRLGGQDRYETSALVAAKGWESSDYAVLAYGGDFPDALSAAPLAKKYNAPILLTQKDSLPPAIDAQIQRLGVKNLFIVGGTGVVSSGIESALEARGIQVTRLGGQNRYDTAVAIAEALDPSQTIVVVSGENFPDALSIASYAAKFQYPIFLTPKNHVPASVINYQKKHQVGDVFVIGGEGVISRTAMSELLGFAQRISGMDRYQTNFEILLRFDFDYSTVLFANAESFPDALSGSALAALGQSPIILTSPHAGEDYLEDLRYNKNMMKLKYVIGGTGIMPNKLMDEIFK